MTKPKPKPSPQPPAPSPRRGEGQGEGIDALIRHVLTTLGVDVPYYSARLVGNRLELYLYGGQTLVWPIPATLPAHGEGQSEHEEPAP